MVALGQTTSLGELNQVSVVWDPLERQVELYLVAQSVGHVHTVKAQLDEHAFRSGGHATLGQVRHLPPCMCCFN